MTHLISTVAFSLVAVLSFAIWAWGETFFSSEPMMYAGCATAFLTLGGAALLPAVGHTKKRAFRFCIFFAVAYLCYATIWSLSWFTIPATLGEIIGSAGGLLAFTAILKRGMKLHLPTLPGTALLFFFHTLGYYLGGFFYESLKNRGPIRMELPWSASTIQTAAQLTWGACYGWGFAVGVIALYHLSRQSPVKPSTQI